MFQLPKIPPEWRTRLRAGEKFLRTADDLLKTSWYARDGTILERGLAAASTVGSVVGMLLPEQSAEEALLDRGYTKFESGIGRFLWDLIGEAPDVVLESVSHPDYDERERLVFLGLPGHPRALAAVYTDDQFDEGPYLLGGDRTLLQEAATRAWVVRGKDLVLESAQVAASGRTREYGLPRGWRSVGVKQGKPPTFGGASEGLRLSSMKPAGRYIGHPDAEWYAARMRRYGGVNRCIRLWGPSGVGKSTLGRVLGRAMVGPEAHTLRVAAAALTSMSMEDVLDLVDLLRPHVFLLDDMPMEGGVGDLAFLEALHERVRLTVISVMDEDDTPEREDRRLGYRPGRVDETFIMHPPPQGIRRQLLVMFFEEGSPDEDPSIPLGLEACGVTEAMLEDLAEITDRMTGAYIAELVGRLRRHGVGEYRKEVFKLKGEIDPKSRRRRPRRLTAKDPYGPDGYPVLTGNVMSVPQLRGWCLRHSLPADGSRRTLKARISAHVEVLKQAATQRLIDEATVAAVKRVLEGSPQPASADEDVIDAVIEQ